MPVRSTREAPARRGLAATLLAAPLLAAAVAAAAADDLWRYGESPAVGGGGVIPRVGYHGPSDRGFDLMAECRGSGPSIYITVTDPGPDLRQLRFNTPIPVVVRIDRGRAGKATPADEARVTASLSEGYIAHTGRIRVGIGLQDGTAVADLLGRDTGAAATRVIVEIAKTSAAFAMAGAPKAFAQLKRNCDIQR